MNSNPLDQESVDIDSPPEVGDGGDALDAVRAVRTVLAPDLVVHVAAVVLGLRIVPVDEQREVGEAVELECVVEEAVVEAVLVPWTRLAEIGQLVQVVRTPVKRRETPVLDAQAKRLI